MEKSELLSSTKAGEVLGVSREAVRLMVEQGELRAAFVTEGGWRYFDPVDVEDLAQKRRREEERREAQAIQRERQEAQRKAKQEARRLMRERMRMRKMAGEALGQLQQALADYRSAEAMDLPVDIVAPYVAMAMLRISHAIDVRLDLGEPEGWGELGELVCLNPEDVDLLQKICLQVTGRVASAA